MKIRTEELSKAWQIGLIAMLSVLIIMMPEYAFAAAMAVFGTVGTALCSIAGEFTGPVASGIATLGICTLGTLACLGRVTWGQAIVVGVGVAVLFGAVALVDSIDLGVNAAGGADC